MPSYKTPNIWLLKILRLSLFYHSCKHPLLLVGPIPLYVLSASTSFSSNGFMIRSKEKHLFLLSSQNHVIDCLTLIFLSFLIVFPIHSATSAFQVHNFYKNVCLELSNFVSFMPFVCQPSLLIDPPLWAL